MSFKLQQSIKIFKKTPTLLRHLLADLDSAWILGREGENTWNPFDIVGHLIHGEKTDWIPRAEMILSGQKDTPFEPFDRFAQYEASKGKTIQELLDEFEKLRFSNIEKLEAMKLQPHHFELKGTHPDLGEVTLQQLLAAWTVHDLSHINQMTRVMMKNYKDEVGPWQQYISLFGSMK